MKVRVLVEVMQGDEKVRRLRHTEMSSKSVKLYEVIASGPEVLGFIADDVISAALGAVQAKGAPQAALETQARLPAKDHEGRTKGHNMLEETLGLSIVESMIQKDNAGAVQQQFPGRVLGSSPVRR